MSRRLFFEGRYFDLRRLSRIRRRGRTIYALYGGAPIIMHSYDSLELAREGRAYLRRRGAR